MDQPVPSHATSANVPVLKNAVILVGFMGAGKTSVGRELSRTLGWRFVDLDDRIEAAERRTVAAIFAESGEAAFRRAESHALSELLLEMKSGVATVVALGGGAFVEPTNAEAIRASGFPVVFLDAPLEELRRRCAPKGASRPLYRNEAEFARLYHLRRDGYMQADLRVDTSAKSVTAVAVEVLTLLGVKR